MGSSRSSKLPTFSASLIPTRLSRNVLLMAYVDLVDPTEKYGEL